MDSYQQVIHKTRYARYLPDQKRRESWEETVHRYVNFWGDKIKPSEAKYFYDSIYNMDVMPSMRCMMTAGPALERDNVAGYNCSYLPIDHPRAFDELMYILLCGTGVGFSVERQYIQKLPEVAEEFYSSETTIVVADTKIGWAKSLRQLISLLYAGEIPKWDLSKVRPAGAPLRTFGGRASGPAPLQDLLTFTTELFQKAKGRKLSSLECHDLCCKIAEVVVVGGVRRSALLSLSNPSDQRLASAKTGDWHTFEKQRALSNNSACYTEKPDFTFFLKEMVNLYESRTGERGVFNRQACQALAARNGRRETEGVDFGTNPCSEIILRPNQFCNLTEVVVRAGDTFETLESKVRCATQLGSLQATLTDFRYLRSIWKKNTEEEALLGVSLTGIMDHEILSGRAGHEELKKWLGLLREAAVDENKRWAKRLGINPSVAITCVKPSGTVSQLVDSANGIHPRHSPYYIRRISMDAKDPMVIAMKEAGIPWEESYYSGASTLVFSFYKKAPDKAVCSKDVGAMEQLRVWKIYQDYWCEHKPSITVNYTEDDFFEVCAWMWNNFDSLSGIAMLPYDGHTYQQAPYEEISQEVYEKNTRSYDINWDVREDMDVTEGVQELACVGGACEL